MMAIFLAVIIFASESMSSRMGEFAFLARHLSGRRGTLPFASFAFGVAAANAFVPLMVAHWLTGASSVLLLIDSILLPAIIALALRQLYLHAFDPGDDADAASIRRFLESERREHLARILHDQETDRFLQEAVASAGFVCDATDLKVRSWTGRDGDAGIVQIDVPGESTLRDARVALLPTLAAELRCLAPNTTPVLELKIGKQTDLQYGLGLQFNPPETAELLSNAARDHIRNYLRAIAKTEQSKHEQSYDTNLVRLHRSLVAAATRVPASEFRRWLEVAEIAYSPAEIPSEVVPAGGEKYSEPLFGIRELGDLVRSVCKHDDLDKTTELLWWLYRLTQTGWLNEDARRAHAIQAISLIFHLADALSSKNQDELRGNMDNVVHSCIHLLSSTTRDNPSSHRRDALHLTILIIDLLKAAIERGRDKEIEFFFYRLTELATRLRGVSDESGQKDLSYLADVAAISIAGWCVRLVATAGAIQSNPPTPTERLAFGLVKSYIGGREALFGILKRATLDDHSGRAIAGDLQLDRWRPRSHEWQSGRAYSVDSGDGLIQTGFLALGCSLEGSSPPESVLLYPLPDSIDVEGGLRELDQREPHRLLAAMKGFSSEDGRNEFLEWLRKSQRDYATSIAEVTLLSDIDDSLASAFRASASSALQTADVFGSDFLTRASALATRPELDLVIDVNLPRQLFVTGPTISHLGCDGLVTHYATHRHKRLLLERFYREANLFSRLPGESLKESISRAVDQFVLEERQSVIVCDFAFVHAIADEPRQVVRGSGFTHRTVSGCSILGQPTNEVERNSVLIIAADRNATAAQEKAIFHLADFQIRDASAVERREIFERASSDDSGHLLKDIVSYEVSCRFRLRTGLALAGTETALRVPVDAQEVQALRGF